MGSLPTGRLKLENLLLYPEAQAIAWTVVAEVSEEAPE